MQVDGVKEMEGRYWIRRRGGGRIEKEREKRSTGKEGQEGGGKGKAEGREERN